MSMTQAMESLVAGIRAAAAARQTFLSHLDQNVERYRQEVRLQMKGLHREGQKKARELQATLTSLRRHRAEGERNRQRLTKQETEQRRIAQSELRAHTHSFLKRAHLERKEMHTALRAHTASEINSIKSTVRNLRTAARGMLREVAADMCGAHQAWAGVKKSL